MNAKQIKSYLVKNFGECRHNPKHMAIALEETSSEFSVEPFDLFLLVVENKPIDSMHTHSYKFHTANGRHLIDTFKHNYYNVKT